MAGETPNTTPIVVDAEYKDAIQPVVDNNMRTDILGPHFCRVLKDHTPAREDVVALITKEIGSDPALKTAVKAIVTEHNKETKMRFFDWAIGAIGVIIIGVIIWGVEHLISNTAASLHPTTVVQVSTTTSAH